MTSYPSHRPFTAVAGAALLAVSLIAIPAESAAPAVARVEAHEVHLQAVVATEVSAVLNTAGTAEAVSAAAGSEAGGTGVIENQAPTLPDALVAVVTSFVVMTLMAPVSIALSPLYLGVFGLNGSPSWADVVGKCTSVACPFGLFLLLVLPVIGPVSSFADSLGKLWTAVFPSSAPAAAAAAAAGSTSIVETPDVPRAELGPGIALAPAAVPAVAASRSAAATTLDPVTALIDAGAALIRAIAWIPIAAVFTPFWVAMGRPGPASALQPWEPGSDCGGPGVALGCLLRSVAYGLVAAPYVDLGRSVGNLVGSLFPPARVASAGAQAAPVAPLTPVAQVTSVGPRVSATAPPALREPSERRDAPRSGPVLKDRKVSAFATTRAGHDGTDGNEAHEKANPATEKRSGASRR